MQVQLIGVKLRIPLIKMHVPDQNQQGVALTGRNRTGPLCSRRAIIRLKAA